MRPVDMWMGTSLQSEDTIRRHKFYLAAPHCSNWEKVLNENDTPQNQQFLSVYTLEVPKYSKLEKSIGIQGKNSKLG